MFFAESSSSPTRTVVGEDRRGRGKQLDPVLLEAEGHAAGHPVRHLPASAETAP